MSKSRLIPSSLTQAFSLQTRLIIGVVVLILVCMGAAILATMGFGNRVAQESIDDALSRSQSVQARFVQLRLEQLEIQANWFARDPAIVSYILESVDSQSTVSLLDLLGDYQQDVDFDVALVLDADGMLMARTDAPDAEQVDMGDQILVEIAFEESIASGFWLEGKTLYAAVAVPLTQQFDLVGYLIMAQRLDNDLAAEVERLSSAQIVYLIEVDGGIETAASTLSPPEESRLLTQIRSRGGLSTVLDADTGVELMLGEEPFEGLAAPLRDADGERLGATVALTSRQERTSDLRRLLRVLWGVGLVSLLFGVGLATLLSKRLLRPVRSLVSAAEAAREGNYSAEFETAGTDEVGRLARAFDGLLDRLRAEGELRAFVSEVSRSLPEPGEVKAPSSRTPVVMESVAIGALDLRHEFAQVAGGTASVLAERLEEKARLVAQSCARHNGKVVALLGHRLYVAFSGSNAAARSLVGMGSTINSLTASTSAFDEPQPAMGAITMGNLLLGPLRLNDRSQLTVAGPAVQQLDGLLREAEPGDLLISSRVRTSAEADLSAANIEVVERQALLGTQTHFAVEPAAMSQQLGAVLRTNDGSLEETISMTAEANSAGSTAGLTQVPILQAGDSVGERFEVLSVLGKGGMGIVYKARDRELRDLVALKALRPSLIGSNTLGVDTLEQLKIELKMARKVTHANVLRTHEFLVIDDQAWISMEYVRGVTLRELMDRSGLIPRSAALRLLQQLCAGLEAAHEQKVLHGDIKPENIILGADGSAKLMDFGIARPLTKTGGVDDKMLGTPYYMAPEQIKGSSTDARSDIYATGVVAYEILVDARPFDGTTATEVFKKHLQETPRPLREIVPDLPEWLEAVVLRCLAKSPDERFSTAAELAEAFSQD